MAPHLPEKTIVVTKSTVPVGTNAGSRPAEGGHRPRLPDVASNPEFLKEGAAIDDFMKPDRVVVGVREAETAAVLKGCTRRSCAPITRSWSCRPKAPR